MTNGADFNRTAMLLAVLEKKMRLPLGNQDIFLNVVGGLKIDEPAIDLGIIVALVSSMQNRQIKDDVIILGEVGLTGEVRTISFLEKRLIEAEKMGLSDSHCAKGKFKAGTAVSVKRTGRAQCIGSIAIDFGGSVNGTNLW